MTPVPVSRFPPGFHPFLISLQAQQQQLASDITHSLAAVTKVSAGVQEQVSAHLEQLRESEANVRGLLQGFSELQQLFVSTRARALSWLFYSVCSVSLLLLSRMQGTRHCRAAMVVGAC